MTVDECAKTIVADRFPSCDLALLAGSVSRNEQTATSDLDIVVFDQSVTSSFRESFYEGNWPIELFVHSFTSYRTIFTADQENGIPSMPRMVAQGRVLIEENRPFYQQIKTEAQAILSEGPPPWSTQTQVEKRYFLTDTLDDLRGATRNEELWFIVNHLMEQLGEFVLRMNQQWMGRSKWLYRSLQAYDSDYAKCFFHSFQHFYQTGDVKKVVALVEQALEDTGGPMFAGFSIGKT
ncbi:nucleotidyltransferase domain-containing protein [Shouchella sp. JSM 1781072]|uniref:nucleotidyltransferase domain-containing protein n=1 Tax=Bacillaceae TaxID=186817 RepID=UPI0020D08770|nr:nucleotidyltransferase domain-containing protein [Alkalihalobacillus sp. LMS6]UTR06179.1 nucleotidyltransferase domain-containing protein [Alkalihalobacillus sp. LMS6]